MESIQLQGFFAPFIASVSAIAILCLWWTNKNIRYLPYVAMGLFLFGAGFFFSQIVFEKMSFSGAITSSILYFSVNGFFVHAALSRHDSSVHIPGILTLTGLDVIGRIFIIKNGLDTNVYLIFVNGMMGIPMAIASIVLFRHEKRDRASLLISLAFAAIAMMAIVATPVVLSFDADISAESYFSSIYWIALSILTVLGVSLLLISFAFAVGSDILNFAKDDAANDLLSGLLVRRAFEEKGEQLLAECTEHRIPICMVITDIDHFKQVNDQFGHVVGDEVISKFGSLIDEALPYGSIAGRLGGEEFCILLKRADIDAARLYAEGMRSVLANAVFEEMSETTNVTASFGVVIVQSGETLISAIKRADEALYEAKNAGRNQVVVRRSRFEKFAQKSSAG